MVLLVKTKNGELLRPIQRLYPLEIDHDNNSTNFKEIFVTANFDEPRRKDVDSENDDVRPAERVAQEKSLMSLVVVWLTRKYFL